MSDPRQAPDPRLSEKNFGMPMNPAGWPATSDFSPVRRKDGAEIPAMVAPTYGAPNRNPGDMVATDPPDAPELPPLQVTLFRKPGGIRAVTVTEGRVVEFIPKNDDGGGHPVDGVKEWPIDGIWDKDTPNLLSEHAIDFGQVVGVAYSYDKNGYVLADPKPAIAVRATAAGEKSSHYQPPVGEHPGAAGDAFVILARLVGNADSDRLETYHGGSNIEHYHELSPFKMSPGAEGANIFDKYDMVAGEYRYFGIKGIFPISVTQGVADIEISLEGGIDHDLTVRFLKLVTGSPTVVYIDIPSLVVTGTTNSAGAHVHAISPHAHELAAHVHTEHDGYDTGTGRKVAGGGGFLTTETTLATSADTSSAGAHTHTVTGSTTALTASDGSARPSVTLPGAVSLAVDPSAGYLVYCYRKGVLVGVFQNGVAGSSLADVADRPALPDGGTTSEFCVWGGP